MIPRDVVMLEWETMKFALYHAAAYFAKRCPKYELDEFVSIAWLECHKLDQPRFVTQGTIWAIGNYLKREARLRQHEREVGTELSRQREPDPSKELTDRDALRELFDSADLSQQEREMLYLYYFTPLNQRGIATELGCKRQYVSLKLGTLLARLRYAPLCRNSLKQKG